VYFRQYSATQKPVLAVAPGDTLHTTTVDAGGIDAHGVRRAAAGDPLTGPFFIETAMPGDTLVVHIVHLKLNRDWALSGDGIVRRGLNDDLAVTMRDAGQPVRWRLDLARNLAVTEKPGDHLAHFTVPIHPMLGCIGVAPSPGEAPPNTADSGPWGGNMDFNELGEGATVFLPVRNPGALLYFGDGHAEQGDGELNGDALETSLDVEITVDVIPKKEIPAVRAVTATHIMTLGMEGSLDAAFRAATANMARWLVDEFGLSPSEVAQVIGTSAEYRVAEVADRNAAMVLKISRERLRALAPSTGPARR